jgi:hypothetical protein
LNAHTTLRVVFVLIGLGIASIASADVVTAWNAAALQAIRPNKTPPPRASRALAILHASIYDAVNGILRTHETYFVPSDVPASASVEAAVSAAAHRVVVALFPDSQTQFDALHEATLASIPEGPHKASAVNWGVSVADRMLTWRANDNADALVPALTSTGPGNWVPTPPLFAAYLLPQWGEVTPFVLPTGAHFRPLGPPALGSARYAEDYNEMKALGAAVGATRTPDQQQIALFWADGAGTETPPGHWNAIARAVASARGNTVAENARLFALLNVAMADAAIAAWDAKYAFHSWRPVTAIRGGDLDGNPATVADPTWSSFIVTPPFPDYISGHSTFSGAASTVLARFYGTDTIPFAIGSDFLPGIMRSFSSFSAAAREAAESRLYGGIHCRSANDDGLAVGIQVGTWAFTRVMRAKGNRSR